VSDGRVRYIELNMIFVAYSHVDDGWRKDLCTMAAPLRKYGGLQPYSDRDIKPGGNWREEINKFLSSATVAVLLVSRHFLASKFIMEVELPAILEARKTRKLEVVWVLASHCLWKETELEPLQAVLPTSVSLEDMSEAKKSAALKAICDQIKDVMETPVLDPALAGRAVTRKMEDLKLLARPAIRRVEIFIRADNSGDWYHQGGIAAGKQHCTCSFGTNQNQPITGYHIIAMTTKAHVPHQGGKPTKPLPNFIKLANEVRVLRKS
jgi:hypothetical protein